MLPYLCSVISCGDINLSTKSSKTLKFTKGKGSCNIYWGHHQHLLRRHISKHKDDEKFLRDKWHRTMCSD